VDEAKQALLMAKQCYIFVPCHFLAADRSGHSFAIGGHRSLHLRPLASPRDVVCFYPSRRSRRRTRPPRHRALHLPRTRRPNAVAGHP
jgi:hypothetical protein